MNRISPQRQSHFIYEWRVPFRKRGPHGVERRPRWAFRRQRLWSFQWIKKQTATWQCGDVPLYFLPWNWFGFVFACCPFATVSRVQTAALIAAKLLFVWMWWMDVSHLSPFCALICSGRAKNPNPAWRALIKRAQMSKQPLCRCVARSLSALIIMLLHCLHDTASMITFITSLFDCVISPPSRLLHAGTVGAALTDWIGGGDVKPD